jgi:ribonuclease P protein component
MLPRSGRLRRRADFERAYQQGRRIRMATFTLYVYPRRDDEPTRVGIVAGRRFKTLVQRNRVKRRLRAACRALWMQMAPGYDLVLVTHEPALSAPFEQIQQELRQALQPLQILKAEGGAAS